MLIFGDYKCFPDTNIIGLFNKGGFVAFNFSSYVQSCPQLSNLLPKGVDCSSDENFDMSYFDYIFKNDYAFIDFMYIINQLYNGATVFIFINHTEFYDKLTESLAEIIKQRYGYISYFINEPEDYELLMSELETSECGSFSAIGLSNLDIDRSRFLSLLQALGLFKDNPEDYT